MSKMSKEVPALESQKQFLKNKLRVMAFMELVFQRAPNDRVFTFKQVADALKVQETEVESVVVKALSLKCVKGLIDQVDQEVS
jgi:26S proteasome regulatory subunit N9